MSEWFDDQKIPQTESNNDVTEKTVDSFATAEDPSTPPQPRVVPPVAPPVVMPPVYDRPMYTRPTGYVYTPSQPVMARPQPTVPLQPPVNDDNAQPPVPPTVEETKDKKEKNKKKSSGNVPLIIMSILCGVCLLGMFLLGGLFIKDRLGNGDGQQNGQTQATQQGTLTDDNVMEPDSNAPTLPPVDDGTADGDTTPTVPTVPGDSTGVDDGGLSTAAIVSKNLDSTVMLTMYMKASIYGGYYEYYYGADDLLEVGSATGIIYSAEGYIITNSHCVYDTDYQVTYDRIVVTLYNGEEYDAKIVGYDPTTDLAVIKITPTGTIVPAEFGDSSAVALGDRVVTLGNSGGLSWSASQGILSGLARDVYEDTGYAIQCLQVDAVINPGSSGGPLFDKYGHVIGINSAKIVMSGHEGLGFSIPINEAIPVINDLARYGYVKNRVSLGIMGYTVDSVGYEGFMIDSIDSSSVLVGTKAKEGDIIIEIDGVRVMNYEEMRAELTSHNVGDTVTLTLLRLDRITRKTQEIEVTVTLQESKS